ncbi:hypothetical protein DTO169C6_3262 [Paecilomyces variotii]|nr:hypothetical protein DTO169C6_3262 [Paecilomyces variotii]
MAEYWKSAPRYWCKHCKVFIRDTTFEKTQHEATAKHQSNLKRFLRDIHRNQERHERESQRAKDEVQRLTSLVSGSSSGQDKSDAPWKRNQKAAAPSSRPVSLEERKKQMAQLAEMGVAIPDEFRREMALAGEWQTVSERVIDTQDEEKPERPSLNIGVRKRKLEGQEAEEEEEAQRAVKKNWGSTTRQYPGAEDDEDLDALLESTKNLKGKGPAVKVETKTEEPDEYIKQESSPPPPAPAEEDKPPTIKKEESFQGIPESIPEAGSEAQEAAPGVVFKKRKPKFAKK